MAAHEYPILLPILSSVGVQAFRGRPATDRGVLFLQAVAEIETGIERGEIANVVYKDAKDTIHRAFALAWDKTIDPITYDRDNPLSDADRKLSWTLSDPQSHLVESYRNRVTKHVAEHGETRYTHAVAAFLDEIAPLATMVRELKDKVVKRQPKPVEDRKEKYEAPAASKGAIGMVKAVLTQVTEQAYQQMLANTIAHYNHLLDQYVALVPVVQQQPADGIIDRWRTSKEARELEYFQAQLSRLYYYVYDAKAKTRSADADAAIVAEATKDCDMARENFIYKNLDKIASILDAKKDFDKIENIGYRTSIAGLEGTFAVTFKDGASFVMKNSVVYVVNSYGTQFNRFPLTFHDAYKADGTKIKGVSEKKMNEEFVV